MTSTAFLNGDWRSRLTECMQFSERCHWQFGVQLHNSAPSEQIEALRKCGIPLSVHAPLNQKFNWNLAAADTGGVMTAIRENLDVFIDWNIRSVVFHCGCMSDLIPEAFGHGKSYDQCMKVLFRPELAMLPGNRLNRDFSDLPEFAVRQKRMRERLAAIRTEYPDFLICVENDFPAYGACNMRTDEIIKLGNPICLDTGHLWITDHLFCRDFHADIKQLLQSGLVKMCHFHASTYTDAIPKEQWSDGHKGLSTPNPGMDLPRVARLLLAYQMDYFVLEVSRGSVDDLRILRDWLSSAENDGQESRSTPFPA